MKIKITADSTCDLSPELIERYNVGILPLSVIMGEKVYKDGIDIKPTDIFSFVKENGVLPKSSAPSVEEYTEYFKRCLEDCDTVIHINISSKASVSHENAATAAKSFDGKVYAVDSYALSTGQGLLVLKACDLVAEGKKPQEIVDTIMSLRDKVNTSFVPDALDYLHKGGRCSLAALMGAKVLKLHPMIDMKDGKLYAKKKYMGGIERCIKNYISDLSETYHKYDNTRCFITHSSCEPEIVEKARKQVEETFSFKEVLETTAGCVVTTHCGKNTLGVLFIHE
ncbi:MAG: DegV family protein [Clostridiales bacterium]|nr:DegV family protein [Clostridiales bacterium]